MMPSDTLNFQLNVSLGNRPVELRQETVNKGIKNIQTSISILVKFEMSDLYVKFLLAIHKGQDLLS